MLVCSVLLKVFYNHRLFDLIFVFSSPTIKYSELILLLISSIQGQFILLLKHWYCRLYICVDNCVKLVEECCSNHRISVKKWKKLSTYLNASVRISTSKSDHLVRDWKMVDCPLWIGGESLL